MVIAHNWGLTSLIETVGTEAFGTYMMDSMRQLTGANHCNLVRYANGQQQSHTLFTLGDITPSLATDCATLYDKNFYRHDPAFQRTLNAAGETTPQVLHREFEQIIDTGYRQSLFERCHITDKASIFHNTNNGGYSLHLYRLEGDGRFRDRHLLPAESVLDVLDALLTKHIRLLEQQEVVLDLAWVSQKLRNNTGDILTPRELEVCARIVLGYSSLAISLNLGISINTVLTHRRKAYEKLGIGTQSQLFMWLMQGNQS